MGRGGSRWRNEGGASPYLVFWPLAAAAHTDRGNTHRWLKRWRDVGLVVQGRESSTRFRASPDPALVPLVTLFRQSSELVADLRASLAKLEDIEAAAIFGSYARHEEKASSDVDVLVVGDVSELKPELLK